MTKEKRICFDRIVVSGLHKDNSEKANQQCKDLDYVLVAVRVVDSLPCDFSDAFVSSLISKTGLETGFSHVQERCEKIHKVVEGRGKVSLDCD